MNTDQMKLVHKREELLFVFCLIASLAIIVSLLISVVGAVILAALGLITWFSHAISMAHIQVNGVRLRETQFPSLYERTKQISEAMGLKKMPEVYIVESGGVLNAFATRIFSQFGKDFVILYSDFVELAEDGREDEVEYVIAHELAHIKRNHIGKNFYVFPAMWVPFLGEAYSRACEYTCDRMAVHYTQKPDRAIQALLVFAAGKRLFKNIQLPEFLEQYNEKKGFLVTLMELVSTHPPLPKRIAAIEDFAGLPESAKLKRSTKYVIIMALGAGILIPAAFTALGIYAFTSFEAAVKDSGILEDDSEDENLENPPLFKAAEEGNAEEAMKLIEEGADPNEQNKIGETTLIGAVYGGDPEMVTLLLENGADPKIEDEYGYIPLTTAAELENVEIAKLLLEAGSDPNHENGDGETIFDIAQKTGNEEFLELLNQYK
ncbi:M48 family metallopeptidase [Bacillus sp. SJS]|uniref:M48 family metallopeptidase n=1 Tax=Bacillus sp. SJS TaxID=1423321 RepID=UPI0004DD461F|nr:M48 family metallopeptidase [Bacillus sp. SJS]KZZ84090.1 hypothetical protein AS29_012920 [Bacillus sp. SJS]